MLLGQMKHLLLLLILYTHFKRAVDPATGSKTNTPMFAIKKMQKRIYEGTMDISTLGVTAIDDHTLKVDLEYSYEKLSFHYLFTCIYAMQSDFL